MSAIDLEDILNDKSSSKHFASNLKSANRLVDDDLYNSDEIVAIYGKPNSGKSLFALQDVAKLSAEGYNILYIDTEGSIVPMMKKWMPIFEKRFGKRKGKVLVHKLKNIQSTYDSKGNTKDMGLMEFLGYHVNIDYKSKHKTKKVKGKLEFNVVENIDNPQLEEMIKKHKIDLVILDSMSAPLKIFTKCQQNYPARCFDSDTKVLTQQGWKDRKDIKVGMKALSINSNKKLEWKDITNIYEYDYDGDMIRFGNGMKMDLLVTPNHKMLAEKYSSHPYKKINDFEVVEAQNLKYGHRLIRTGEWVGKHQKYITIPSYTNHRYGKILVRDEIKIKMNDFLEFFGLWLSDGFYGRRTIKKNGNRLPSRIEISQIKDKHKKKIRNILDNLPFKYSEHNRGFTISNVQFASFIYDIMGDVHAKDKFIPTFIKELDIDNLKHLINGYVIGDGTVHKGNKSIFTSSKQMLNDLSEVLIKCGYLISIKVRKGGVRDIKGTNYNSADNYSINISEHDTGWFVRKNPKFMKKVKYNGIVWSPEVKDNHSLVVNRNGKISITGNSDASTFILRKLLEYQEKYNVAVLLINHATYNPADPYETKASVTGGESIKYFGKRLIYVDKRQKLDLANYRRLWLVRGENAAPWSLARVALIDDEGYHDIEDEKEAEECFTATELGRTSIKDDD